MRIVYGTAGEGMGHAVRSQPIIEHLIRQGHKVLVVSSGKPFRYLKQHFPKHTLEVSLLHLPYIRNKVSFTATLLSNLMQAPAHVRSLWKLSREFSRFKPQAVISDFEPFSHYVAALKGIPLIQIDNQGVIACARLEFPKSQYHAYLASKFIVNVFAPLADERIIMSFYHPPLHRRAHYAWPVLREAVLRQKPCEGGPVLVYQTTPNPHLLATLKRIPEQQFIVYGNNIERKDKNLAFHKFNEAHFFEQLATCKALIATGLTTMTEALYLHKPVFAVPIGQQFEQLINAVHIRSCGYGDYNPKPSAGDIRRFLKRIPAYRARLARYPRGDPNKEFFGMLDRMLQKMKRTR